MSIYNLPQLAPGELEPSVDLIPVYHRKTGEEMKLQLSAVSAQPSGVSGAIQFSNGSAFASDAANLFWDDTNNRLGIGTNAPTASLELYGGNSIKLGNDGSLYLQGARFATNNGTIYFGDVNGSNTGVNLIPQGGGANGSINFGAVALAQFKGKGSTSATTSLLVQNSSATSLLSVRDNGSILINGLAGAGGTSGSINFESNGNDMSFKCAYYYRFFTSDGKILFGTSWDGVSRTYAYNENKTIIGSSSVPNTSAQLQVVSTTTGFLPPRMTTTQKNAISSPAAGLVVYDSTTNKLCCYNGSTWNDLF